MNTTTKVYISNQLVSVYRREITIKHNNDLRTTCDFVVQDPTGLVRYSERQPVRVEDDVRGRRFSGYINKVTYTNMHPNPDTQIAISCVDESDLAQKAYARRDYINQDAGDIVADLHTNHLAGLGVTAAYAVRRDAGATQFGLGTLSNVVASSNVDDGDLELTPAGDEVTISETTTADFSTGTLTNVTANSNALALSPLTALKFQGTSQQGANDNYVYLKIWSGSLTINSGDNLVFTQWVSSTSPKITGGMELYCTDGTSGRSVGMFDQNGLFLQTDADLSGYADDQWYTRTVGLLNFVGKTVSYACIAQEGNDNGPYTFYISDARIVNSGGTTRATLFNTSLAQTPVLLSDTGYSDISLTVVTAYQGVGTRVSPAYSLADAGIVRNSLVSWTQWLNGQLIANDAQGPNSVPYSLVQSSIDGGSTWQECSNHGAIPNLYAGMSTSGVSVQFKETLQIAGPDPTIAPMLNDFTATVQPSYMTTVTNVQSKYNSTNWASSGTYNETMTGTFGDLNLNGVFRNWKTDTNPLGNITLFGGTPVSGINQPNSSLGLRCDASTDVRARIDDAGNWGDCTIECDVYLADNTGNYGIEYGTTSWNNSSNSYAYNAFLTSTAVQLARGGNGSSSFTSLATVTIPLTTGQWYHLKVMRSATGTHHTVWVNDVQYISLNDSTYSAPGGIALRHFNSAATRHTGNFQSFGVLQSQSGTWVSNGVSLSSLSTFGASLIQWNDDTPSNATLLIESSVDNGSTYQTCTNNAAIPNATPGTSASGKTLKIRASLSTQNANATPNLHGLSVLLSSVYSASGNRISPALSLDSAGTAGSASVQWNAIVPTNTTLNIDTSPDGSTWTNAGSGASGSVAIPGITTQQDAVDDSFDSDTSASYTSTARTGGTAGGWSWDIANSRLTGTNTGAVLLYTSTSTKDVDLIFDLDTAETAGVVWRWTNASNFYELVVHDASSASSPDTVALYKTVSGTRTQIGSSATISFVRGTPYRARVTMAGSAITVTFDGAQVFSVTDSSLASAGKAGLHTSGSARFYQFRLQALGQSVVGQFLYTRARLASTDPTATPQLEDLTLSVRSPDIITGTLIPEAKYSVLTGSTNTVFDDLNDLGTQSNAVATIDMHKALKFVDRTGTPTPWIVTSDDMLATTDVTVATNGDKYRNREILSGGTDTISRVEKVVGDGITQTWRTSYKVQSVNSISVNGDVATFGVQGVDSGKDFYYTPGETGFSQDTSETPLDDTQIAEIDYLGTSTATVIMSEDDQITELAILDGTDGVIEAAEDVSQQALGIEAMLQLAESRLDQYAILSHAISFTTLRDGLMPNQIASVFIPAYLISDGQYVISSVSENIDAVNVEYDVAMTDGPTVYDYQHYLSDR